MLLMFIGRIGLLDTTGKLSEYQPDKKDLIHYMKKQISPLDKKRKNDVRSDDWNFRPGNFGVIRFWLPGAGDHMNIIAIDDYESALINLNPVLARKGSWGYHG